MADSKCSLNKLLPEADHNTVASLQHHIKNNVLCGADPDLTTIIVALAYKRGYGDALEKQNANMRAILYGEEN